MVWRFAGSECNGLWNRSHRAVGSICLASFVFLRQIGRKETEVEGSRSQTRHNDCVECRSKWTGSRMVDVFHAAHNRKTRWRAKLEEV